MLGAQALEADALVRGVLIDEDHAIGRFAEQVAVEDLSHEAQAREPFGRRLPERPLAAEAWRGAHGTLLDVRGGGRRAVPGGHLRHARRWNGRDRRLRPERS